MSRTTLAVVWLVVAFAAPCRAQRCFHPKPAPECQEMWIAELTLEKRDGTLAGSRLDDWALFGSAALGGMSNVSRRWALGGAFVMVARQYDETNDRNGLTGRLGVVVRARRWLVDGVSLDVTAGVWQLRGVRPTVEAGVEVGGLFALTVGARGDRLVPRRGEVYLGGRFGSEAAVGAALFAVLKFVAALTAYGAT